MYDNQEYAPRWAHTFSALYSLSHARNRELLTEKIIYEYKEKEIHSLLWSQFLMEQWLHSSHCHCLWQTRTDGVSANIDSDENKWNRWNVATAYFYCQCFSFLYNIRLYFAVLVAKQKLSGYFYFGWTIGSFIYLSLGSFFSSLVPFICSSMASFIYSSSVSLISSSTVSFMYSSLLWFIYSSLVSFIYWSTVSSIYSSTVSFIYSPIVSFIYSPSHSIIYSSSRLKQKNNYVCVCVFVSIVFCDLYLYLYQNNTSQVINNLELQK